MDMRKDSAMTEASGLVNDRDGAASVPETVPGAERGRNSRPLQSDSRESALRVAEQLRKVDPEGPLAVPPGGVLAGSMGGLGGARRRGCTAEEAQDI